jgi:hypothetical protein
VFQPLKAVEPRSRATAADFLAARALFSHLQLLERVQAESQMLRESFGQVGGGPLLSPSSEERKRELPLTTLNATAKGLATPPSPPQHQQQQTPKQKSGGGSGNVAGSTAGLKSPAGGRPGSWTCPAPGCGAHCFTHKTKCFKCGMLKPGLCLSHTVLDRCLRFPRSFVGSSPTDTTALEPHGVTDIVAFAVPSALSSAIILTTFSTPELSVGVFAANDGQKTPSSNKKKRKKKTDGTSAYPLGTAAWWRAQFDGVKHGTTAPFFWFCCKSSRLVSTQRRRSTAILLTIPCVARSFGIGSSLLHRHGAVLAKLCVATNHPPISALQPSPTRQNAWFRS